MTEMTTKFPILDFSKSKINFDSFAEEIFQVSSEWGFFILTGHGVKNVDRMFELSRDFFDLPLDIKAEKSINKESIGYDGDKLTSFAASEGVSFGTPSGGVLTSDNLPVWWDTSKRQEIENFKSECKALSTAILSCFAMKLGVEKDYFDANHQSTPGNTLKMIKYPRFDSKPGEIPRLSEHTDWGSLTFVFTAQPGLEVRDPKNRWYNVPLVPGGIIVNIADALSLWSNKALKSTMHRISWENLDVHSDRYSIAYFSNPDYDALLSLPNKQGPCESEAELTFGDYYKIRFGLTFGSTKNAETFGSLNEEVIQRVRSLNVANSGVLVSHAVST